MLLALLPPSRAAPPPQVCGQQVFTQVEDRPVVKERTERWVWLGVQAGGRGPAAAAPCICHQNP
jgi:hypothetical protein